MSTTTADKATRFAALHQGPAYAEKLIWSFVDDPTTRYGSLTTGQSNVIYDVPGPDWATAQTEYEVQQYITPGRPDTLDLNKEPRSVRRLYGMEEPTTR